MKKVQYLILILIGVTFLGLHPSTMEKAYAATEFYVDASNGDDAWPGTETQPWKTITKAANTLTAGETVFIKEGTYNEKVIPANSGNADNWITYAAYPGDTVTIDGTGIELDFWNGLFHIDDRDFIVVDGIRITNSELIGFLCMNADHITVRNCYFTNTQSSGIHARENSSNITIHDNELFHTNTTYSQEGISITGVNGFEVFNNHVHEFPIVSDDGYSQCGIDAKKGSTNGSIHHNEVYSVRVGIYIDGFDQTNSNINVYNNLVYDCQEVGIAINAEQGGTVENCNVYNNISHSNAYHGLKVNDYGSSYSNISFINNSTYKNGLTPLQIARDVNVTNLVVRNNSFGCETGKGVGIYHPYDPAEHHFDHNLYQYEPYFGTDYQTGDPKYFDPGNGDFRIGFGSPCIDNGDSTGAPIEDYNGVSRPYGAGYDIGAFELYGIIFMDEDATGANDGTSWANAYTGFQDALDDAEAGDVILVAEGTYKPTLQTDPADPRTATFQMVNEVAIYGGFDPSIGADEFSERDWENNATIFSGDIGTVGDNSDNCYHVFYHPDGITLDSSAILDGFIISDGNADNDDNGDHPFYHEWGGGMYNNNSSPIVSNCTFNDNLARNGGGMFNLSETIVINCAFNSNIAGHNGGGIYNHLRPSSMTNCTFTGNIAGSQGGAMFNNSSTSIITGCTLSANLSGKNGGGICNLDSPTIVNCIFNNNSAGEHGGGIHSYCESSPEIIGCTFTANTADYGGGMANLNNVDYYQCPEKPSPTITNCVFNENTASQNGGGIFSSESKLIMYDCTFEGNSATGNGGGIYNKNASLNLTDCTLTSNSAVFGAGMYNLGSSPTIAGCILLENIASNAGGGMFNTENSSPRITNSQYIGNTATNYGGGMFNVGAGKVCNPDVTNSIFNRNESNFGGGIYNDDSSPSVTNCTFTDNSAATSGGGIHSYNNSLPVITNSIYWGNAPNGISEFSSSTTVTYCDVEGGYTGTDNIDEDPLLTPDFHLQSDSPCIDTGDNSVPNLPATDFEGDDRIIDGDDDGTSTVDMGADEVVFMPDIIYVDKDATRANDGSSWTDAFNSLQNALDIAVAGNEIWVAAGTYKPTSQTEPTDPRTATFQMRNGVAIYGGFDPSVGADEFAERDWGNNATILSGDLGVPNDNSDNSYHVFYHPPGLELDSSAVLDGFTITDGNANGEHHPSGGGMYNDESSPTVTNCVFQSNVADIYDPTASSYAVPCGGGMANRKSMPTINGCIFRDNTSYMGGGMYNYDSSPKVSACILLDNLALDNWLGGGGIHNSNSSPTIINCTFAHNKSSSMGGAIYDAWSTTEFVNCTIVGNISDEEGGGLGNYYSLPTFTNCILWGNAPDEIYSIGSDSPTFTYCDIKGGYSGTGNIDQNPLLTADFHLQPTSPCTDAGDNTVPNLPVTDFEGDNRIIDGDGDGIPIVDIGADEGPDNQPELPLVIFDSSTYSVQEDVVEGIAKFTVKLSVPSSNTVTVNYASYDGTATAPADYGAVNGVLNFPPNTVCANLDIPITDDCVMEPDELFGISLTNPTNASLGWPSTTTITIVNVDRIHVDAEASGANTGTSWIDAYTDLQDALDDSEAGDSIWVATGTYTPTTQTDPTDPRTAAFQMINGVAIYGGFNPSIGADEFAERDWGNNATILSGDIGVPNDNSDNSYHVFYHPDEFELDSSAILDGFTINAGNASDDKDGGGIYNNNSSPTITNCIFRENSADHGGAMYNILSSPIVKDCIFMANTAASGGGIFNDEKTSLTIDNCTFQENMASGSGGGVYNLGGYGYPGIAMISNSTFIENTASSGGGICNSGSLNLSNSIFTRNSATTGGGLRNNDRSSSNLTNCTFVANTASGNGGGIATGKGGYKPMGSKISLSGCIFKLNEATNGGGMYNVWALADILNSTFEDNTAEEQGGGMYFGNWSGPGITNCVFKANTAGWDGGGVLIGDSQSVTNCTFVGNSAPIGGGISSETSESTITNCIFWDNDDDLSECTATYSDIQDGDAGTGNISVNPLMTSDYLLHSSSPCIDAGDNSAPNIPGVDYEGDNRVIDGDGNGSAIVDMGADEWKAGQTELSLVKFDSPDYIVIEDVIGGTIPITVVLSEESSDDVAVNYASSDGSATASEDYIAVSGILTLPAGTASATFDVAIINDELSEPNETLWLTLSDPENAILGWSNYAMLTIVDDQNEIIYVDADAISAGNGLSWEDAFNNLQSGLNLADTGDEIWVAEGTYYPTNQTDPDDPRTTTFQMKNGVSIYGGFDPSTGDDEFAERDWKTNVTILSGDIGVLGDNFDNSYHVFYHPEGSMLSSSAILDGFKITSGNASGGNTDDHAHGGGMHNNKSSPTIVNCTFENSSGSYNGGGMYNYNSSPILNDCIFQNNYVGFYSHGISGGGGMCNYNSSPMLTDCTFKANTSEELGGGMFNYYSSSPTLVGCTFEDNIAEKGGGIGSRYDTSATLNNCVFKNNTSQTDGGAIRHESHGSLLVVSDCIFEFNTAINRGGGVFLYSSDAIVTNSAFVGNISGSGGAVFAYQNAERILTNCTFSENVAINGKAIAIDSYSQQNPGKIELANCILWDGGDEIWNNDESSVNITYSCIQDQIPGDGIVYDGIGNIDVNPLLASDYHLHINSPCVDTGDNTAPNLPNMDFEGDDRVLDGNGDGIETVDMGIDEALPGLTELPFISFESPTYTVNEEDAGGTAIITVQLSEIASGSVTVNYATSDGTAINPEDYTAVSDVLTISPGSMSATFEIPIVSDGIPEPDETIELTLSNPNNAILGWPNNTILTITENAGMIYVDAEASGANNGSDWKNAFTNLQDALDAAGSGDEIWVAEGTYKPSIENGGSGDRYKSFQMKNNVAIYGGFDPTVGDLDFAQRNWKANSTILSGDIGVPGDKSDNCYHVFYHPGGLMLDSTAVIDGFTISKGNTSDITNHYPHVNGGGMYNANSSPTINNCIFSSNSADRYYGYGGGMYNYNSSPIVTNCTFADNSSSFSHDSGGGGMYNASSSPLVSSCVFKDNFAHGGGGMYNSSYSSPIVVNCVFEGNSVESEFGSGGGMYNNNASPTISNCIFIRNVASYKGGAIRSWGSSIITNCLFINNTAEEDGGAIAGGVITNCILWDNTPNEVIGTSSVTYSNIKGGHPGIGNINADPLLTVDFHLQSNSPCIDVGNNSAPNLPATDFEGDERIINGTVDMGADEYSIPLTGSITGHVDLQGRAGSSGLDWMIDATVHLWEADAIRGIASPLATCNITTDETGSFEIPDVAPGLYDITIKGSHTLRNLVENVIISAGSDTYVDFGTLIEGDCWGDGGPDNVIDGADYSAIIHTFGTYPGHADFIETCDLNQDGVVDGLDYSIVLFNFGMVGVEPF